MASTNLAPHALQGEPIAFEQPLTERMRMFLRIEFLHQQAVFHARQASFFGARAAVASLLEILSITSRGDIRGDTLKELDRHADRLAHYRSTPGVDGARLASLIHEIDVLRGELSQVGKSFMADLRENEFLSAVRHRSSIPGGTCDFDVPEYGYWLRLPADERAEQLEGWISRFRPLYDAIAQVLWLTREASEPQPRTADAGFYQDTLGKSDHCDLIRVLMTPSAGLYPEISAGQHRFTIRFVEWLGVDERPKQTTRDVEFLLALR